MPFQIWSSGSSVSWACVALGLPVPRASHLAVGVAGDADRVGLHDWSTTRRVVAAVADPRPWRTSAPPTGCRSSRGGPPGTRRACPCAQVGHVVEHAVRRVVVGAERRPRVGAHRAPRERHLVEAALRHRHADLRPAADGVAGSRRAEVHRRRVLLVLQIRRGAPHDGAERRHGDRRRDPRCRCGCRRSLPATDRGTCRAR